jgi:hypothetical protein
MLWNDGVDMAEFGMTRVRIGIFQHAMAYPEANSERFESIEAKLDELRSYLYANRESVRGYAEAYRNGERVSTAHVESTVNQSINWRMCKKHQMGWSPSRSPAIASRENRDHQQATGSVYRASFSTGGYRRLTPRFLSVSINQHLLFDALSRCEIGVQQIKAVQILLAPNQFIVFLILKLALLIDSLLF